MNEPIDDLLDQWIRERRSDAFPQPAPDFVETTIEKIESSAKAPSLRLRDAFLRTAAVLMAGLVGFLRIELILHLLVNTL